MPALCGTQAVAVAASDDLWLAGSASYAGGLDGIGLTCQGANDGYTARLGYLSSPLPAPPPTTPSPPPPTTPSPPTLPPAPLAVYIPNIITPNSDGRNDYFMPSNLPSGRWRLRIYSRWGQLVYEAADYRSDWSAHGLAAGLYYYHLEANGLTPYQGWVEVVR